MSPCLVLVLSRGCSAAAAPFSVAPPACCEQCQRAVLGHSGFTLHGGAPGCTQRRGPLPSATGWAQDEPDPSQLCSHHWQRDTLPAASCLQYSPQFRATGKYCTSTGLKSLLTPGLQQILQQADFPLALYLPASKR